MRIRPNRRGALVALALGGALLLAGCADDATGPGPLLPWQGPPSFVREFAGSGALNEEFEALVSGAGADVWVTQSSPPRLWNFDAEGRVRRRIELAPLAPRQYLNPTLLARAPDGSTWIVEANRGILLHLSAEGTALTTVADGGGAYGTIGRLRGLAVAPDGRVYVLDTNARRVLVYSAEGERLFEFGRRGATGGAFEAPQALAVDAAGQVYLLDAEFGRVLRYEADGTFVSSWEHPGYQPGQISAAGSLLLGPDDTILLGERYRGVINVFTRGGEARRTVAVPAACGRGNTGITGAPALLPGGDFVVIDACSEAIHRFDARGNFVTRFSASDPDAFVPHQIVRLVVDPRGHLFSVPYEGQGIVEMDEAGRVVGVIDGPPAPGTRGDFTPLELALDPRGFLCRSGRYGSLILRTPLGGGATDTLDLARPEDVGGVDIRSLAVGADGRLFAAIDLGPVRVCDASGRILADWEVRLPPELERQLPTWYRYRPSIDAMRRAEDGTLWLLDGDLRALLHCDGAGHPLGGFRFAWEGVEGVREPVAFDLSPDGYLDVVNRANQKIYRFTTGGEYLFRWGTPGPEPGGFCHPTALAWDGRGSLYVADSGCPRVVVYAY